MSTSNINTAAILVFSGENYHICTTDCGKWYMKTGGATFEGNPDGYLGQNKVDKSLVHYDLKTKALPVARLEFLKMKLGLTKANLKEEC